jgi:hypothetical protein
MTELYAETQILISALLLKGCHSLQSPLEGDKKQETEKYFGNHKLGFVSKALRPLKGVY